MSDPIVINRYASRRLYNTNSSEYITLEEVAALIRAGHEIEIRDRKSGEDLTRQYLLQIITEQESRGESVLPVNVLTGLVRSYSSTAQNYLPEFLSKSFDAFTEQQEKMMRQFSGGKPGNVATPSGFGSPADWQKKQAEIYSSMMRTFAPQLGGSTTPEPSPTEAKPPPRDRDDVSAIKEQLAELQRKLDNL